MAYFNPYSQLIGNNLGQEGDRQPNTPFTVQSESGSHSDDDAPALPDQSGSFDFNNDHFALGNAAPVDTTTIAQPLDTGTHQGRRAPRAPQNFDISKIVDPGLEQWLKVRNYDPHNFGSAIGADRVDQAAPQTFGLLNSTDLNKPRAAPPTSAFFKDRYYHTRSGLPTFTAPNAAGYLSQAVAPITAPPNNNHHDPRGAPPTVFPSNGYHNSLNPPLPSPYSNDGQVNFQGGTHVHAPFNSFPADMPANSVMNAMHPPRNTPRVPTVPRTRLRVTRSQKDRPVAMAPADSMVVRGSLEHLGETRKRVTPDDDDSSEGDYQEVGVNKRRKAANQRVDFAYGTPAKEHATRTKGKVAVPTEVDDAEESDVFAYSTTPADGARASKKAREKRFAPTDNAAQAPQQQWPAINTNITSTLSLAYASKIATYISPLQIIGKDDWVAVKADKINGIKALMDAFNASLPSEPPSKENKPFPEEMKPLWLHNQTIAYNANMKSITTHPHSRFLESCCTVAWFMLIEAHNTEANPNAGPRQCGTMTVNTKLKCSERLQAMVDAIAGGALVRQDVTSGQRIPDFIANPKAFASKKTVNQRNNAGRKEKFRDLIKRRGS
ncbi:hypothetical protein LTR95_003110 [Oleoguttula sp. CCFEE 5521]